MNKTETSKDGPVLMTVTVNGKEQKRPCRIDYGQDSFSRAHHKFRLIPELLAGEQIIKLIGGEILIVS